jgi:hypothetical protein
MKVTQVCEARGVDFVLSSFELLESTAWSSCCRRVAVFVLMFMCLLKFSRHDMICCVVACGCGAHVCTLCWIAVVAAAGLDAGNACDG